MKNDAESRKQIKAGAIVQVGPDADREEYRLAFLVVTGVDTWGVIGRVCAIEGVRLTWEKFEPTGGKAIWDAAGKRVADPEAPMRHHP